MSLPKIVFLDGTCPKPYNSETLATEPLGGTEATTIRVAEGLAATGRYEVIVAQHNRQGVGGGSTAVNYTSFEALDQIHQDPKAVIALRSPDLIPFAQSRWTDSKFCLWLHDFNQQDVVRSAHLLSGTQIICVSNAHKGIVADAVLKQVQDPKFTISYIYNPVADDLVPDNTAVDYRKLVFFSSPHKGLEHTLKVFAQLKRQDWKYRLIVANPGYMPDAKDLPDGVESVGALPHHEVIKLVRSALCVLHLNDVFDETFGLVHVEANAVGTPVITSHRGANAEVLSPAYQQCIDVRNEPAVINRVTKWAEQYIRPQVSCKDAFRLSNVIQAWRKLIDA